MLRREASISLETYTWCVRTLNLGDIHPTLVGGEMWYPDEMRADRNARVLEELRQQGLATRDNRISEDFEDVLRVMQRAAVEYTTYARIEGVAVTVRAASIGRDAVLVISADGAIDIEPIPQDQMAIRVATSLPDTPAARLHSATAEVGVLNALEKGKHVPPGPRTTDAKRMHKWLKLERTNVGQLNVAIRRSAFEAPTATKAPVPTWIDTEDGRALFHIDSQGWASLAAAGALDIAEKYHQLERGLRERA